MNQRGRPRDFTTAKQSMRDSQELKKKLAKQKRILEDNGGLIVALRRIKAITDKPLFHMSYAIMLDVIQNIATEALAGLEEPEPEETP